VQQTNAFACPFCGAPLAAVRKDLGEDDCTGGFGTLTDFRCPKCKARIEQFVHDKLLWRRETWRLLEKPSEFSGEPAVHGKQVYVCPKRLCGGDLWQAVPTCAGRAGGADISPETALSRTVPFLCERCGAEYWRSEKGTWGAPTVAGWAPIRSFVWRLRGWRLRREPAPSVPAESPRAPRERRGRD
jgi:hypothetical protein